MPNPFGKIDNKLHDMISRPKTTTNELQRAVEEKQNIELIPNL